MKLAIQNKIKVNKYLELLRRQHEYRWFKLSSKKIWFNYINFFLKINYKWINKLKL